MMFVAKDSHWWFQGMSAISFKLINAFYRTGANLRILDAGCGTGSGITHLSAFGTVTGLDISAHAIRFCRSQYSVPSILAPVMELPFQNDSFDLVASYDVLYFKNIDDRKALQESARVLMPGGRIIVRVPAFDWLRGIHDEKVSTRHRYSLQELSRKLQESGMYPEFISYVNCLLFPFILMKRRLEKWLPSQDVSDLAIDLGPFNKILKLCLVLESRLLTRVTFPFGVSLIAVGRKP